MVCSHTSMERTGCKSTSQPSIHTRIDLVICRNLPDWAFHIKNNKTGEQLVFDLGTRKDFWNSVPAIADLCDNHVPGLKVEKDVTEILEEGGVKLSDLKALILSHWHFDHCMPLPALLEIEKAQS